MKRLLILSVLMFTGCGFLFGGDYEPPGAHVEAPSVGDAEPVGNIYTTIPYLGDPASLVDPEVPEEVCDAEIIVKSLDPLPIESKLVTFIYKDIDFNKVVAIERFTVDEVSKLEASKYIHARRATMKLVAGDTFDFFKWVDASIVGPDKEARIAWGGPFSDGAIKADLKLDGSVNMREYWTDEGLRFKGTFRAKSPDTLTYAAGEMEILRFYNCEFL